MKNSLQVGSFSSKNNNKSNSVIPELEGFSNEDNSKMYTDASQFLSNNLEYEECKKNITYNCSEYEFLEADNVQNELNEIEKEREKVNQEILFCQSRTTSCKQLFDEINKKTKEFEQLHNNLIEQDEKINRCKDKKDECDSYEKKIKDLEILINKYEEEVIKLQEEGKTLFCSNIL